MRLLCWGCVLLISCNTTKPGDSTGILDSTEADTDTDTDTDADTDTSGPADIRDQMVRNAADCQELSGTAQLGGNSYYWGSFTGSAAEGWVGEEKFYFFANETAIAAGFQDCEFTWSSIATEADPGRCPNCDIGMAVTATPSDSTCDPTLFSDPGYSVGYAVDTPGNGSSHWFFASSGNAFADGFATETTLSYLSAASCRWF